jgi:hypothetical protein
MQITQLENVITLFTAEQTKLMKDLTDADTKKEASQIHKQLRLITNILNNLLLLKTGMTSDN